MLERVSGEQEDRLNLEETEEAPTLSSISTDLMQIARGKAVRAVVQEENHVSIPEIA